MYDNNKYELIEKAIQVLPDLLHLVEGSWLIGGSCGLLLQGVPIKDKPRDLDLYADLPITEQIYPLLNAYAIDEPQFSTTPTYQSYLSHYMIEGIKVELVGDFRINCADSLYQVEVQSFHRLHAACIRMEGNDLFLMPLAHELVFNILRGRPDRYIPIAQMMSSEPQKHIPILEKLLMLNKLNDNHQNLLKGLFDKDIWEGGNSGDD